MTVCVLLTDVTASSDIVFLLRFDFDERTLGGLLSLAPCGTDAYAVRLTVVSTVWYRCVRCEVYGR